MEYKNALEFLLYSYFGFDGGTKKIEDNKNEIPTYCAKRAYLDLARTVEFKYSTSKLDKMEKKNSLQNEKDEAKAFKKEKEKLISGICKSMLGDTDGKKCNNNDFKDWHKKKCEEIKEKMNKATYDTNKFIINEESFTIGQSQKWLNMTLKYLWLLNILPDGLNEEYLHIPVDSYIIEAVGAKKDNYQYGLELEKSISKSSWSAWDNYDEYMDFQNEVKKVIKEKYTSLTPLEWESFAWIEVAKSKSSN